MYIMNQKMKYVGLIAILVVFAVSVTSNFAPASALEKGQGANRHSTALYDPYLVCGDHLCLPHEKKTHEQESTFLNSHIPNSLNHAK